jgi:PD-(D/E)XK nuclease superfamily
VISYSKSRNGVLFDENSHTYAVVTKLTSVTTFLSSYYPPFTGTTYATERRLGCSRKEVLEMWRVTTVNSQIRGNNLHRRMEYVVLNDLLHDDNVLYAYYDDDLDELCDTILALRILFDSLPITKVHCELLLSDVGARLAGQSDLIVDYDDDSFSVLDYKTNQKDMEESYGNKTMLAPFDGYLASRLNKYYVQLCLYGMLYAAETGKRFRNATIIHIDKKVTLYEIPTDVQTHLCSLLTTILDVRKTTRHSHGVA